MKVVINICYGGFSVSVRAAEELTCDHEEDEYGYGHQDERTCPALVSMLEEFGTDYVSGSFARLAIVEVPDDVAWHIEEYDGSEWVAENHRIWRG